MSKRTYNEYINSGCHPVGYNEPCQVYYFGQTSVDLLLDKINQLTQQLKDYEDCDSKTMKYVNKLRDDNIKFKQQLAKKDKEIEELKDWNEWYSIWYKEFQKQIEDLTIELETYRPTKLHGNGQCECYKCKIEGRQPRHWTDWCNKYKGHIYCDDCLKEILKEE